MRIIAATILLLSGVAFAEEPASSDALISPEATRQLEQDVGAAEQRMRRGLTGRIEEKVSRHLDERFQGAQRAGERAVPAKRSGR